MGWTQYEQLARHVDINCTGETEDPWELPLRTNTTIIIKNKGQDQKQLVVSTNKESNQTPCQADGRKRTKTEVTYGHY